MPFLPIAERELRVAARKKSTYRTRFWAVLLAFVAFSWQLLTLIRQQRPSQVHGQHLFITLSVVTFFYCLFIGARVTADCLSEEKREGTLGLLFLTDLKGYDIVFGKLVANSLNAFYGLIAIVPMLAICLLLGGVSFKQLAQIVFVLVTTLFFSLSAGIFVSTYNRLERVAMFFTILLISACTFGPVLFGFVLASYFGFADSNVFAVMFTPAMALLLAIEPAAVGRSHAFLFPTSLALTWILTIIFLRVASLKLPHSWQEKQTARIASPLLIRLEENSLPRSEQKKFREDNLDQNPFLWLALRGPQKSKHAWGFVFSIITIWIFGLLNARNVMWDYELLFPTVLFIHAFLKIWVTSEACTRLVEDRRSGALELLLSTPLDVKEIIRGQHLALSRQFFSPLLLLIVLEVLCIAFGFVSANRAKYFLFAAACLLAIDFFTLRWVAMWVGLNAKNVNRAIIKTATLVLALPWFIYNLSNNVLPFLWGNRPHPLLNMITALGTWFVIALITNAVLYFWAKPRLLKQFRALATQPVLAK